MRKIYSLAATLFVCLMAHSQVEIGIIAGPQMTNANYHIYHKEQKTTGKYGFQAGVAFKIPFEGRLSFAPEAFYSLKGYKVKYTEFVYPPDVNAIDNDTRFHTFELAFLLQYDLGKNPSHVFIKGGPSLDFQLFGHEKFNLKGGGAVDRKMKFGPGEYGAYTANFLAQIGYETGAGLMIYAQYTYGASSLNNSDTGPDIHHRAYGITIGKYLNRKKIVMDTKNKE